MVMHIKMIPVVVATAVYTSEDADEGGDGPCDGVDEGVVAVGGSIISIIRTHHVAILPRSTFLSDHSDLAAAAGETPNAARPESRIKPVVRPSRMRRFSIL